MNLQLSPDGDMGKAWIANFFEAPNHIMNWYWSAQNATRIEPDPYLYSNTDKFQAQTHENHNELLYALNNAPGLAAGVAPEDVLKSIRSGESPWPKVVQMAAKSETTKPPDKVQETWFADYNKGNRFRV